jgi:transposase
MNGIQRTLWWAMEIYSTTFATTPITRRKRADDRKVINGILFVLTTGCRWWDMTAIYDSRATPWSRLKWWYEECVGDEIIESLQYSAFQEDKFSMDIACFLLYWNKFQEEFWTEISNICNLWPWIPTQNIIIQSKL